MKVKVYDSIAWLKKRFIQEGKTIDQMATEADVNSMTIRRALQKNGLIK